jgi:hypothetical protein
VTVALAGALAEAGIEAPSGPLSEAARAVFDPLAGLEPEVTPRQRRADAVGLVAERALAAGFGVRAGVRAGEAADGAAEDDPAPISGSRTERFQVMLHTERATLARAHPGSGISELEDGTRVSAETSRRLACDCTLVEMTHAAPGEGGGAGARLATGDGASLTHLGPILDIGRRSRTIPPALRRALEVRDRGCRFPGCGLKFTDGHHLRH